MPHFVIDCSESILQFHDEDYILEQIYHIANATELFDEGDIKVRLNPFKKYLVGRKQENFIHVFADIMEGRTTKQKADLSKKVVSKLVDLFPDVLNIAMNVRDFEKVTYCNKKML
jgi:5-carboxymethyl-2-hydroxymuconate isomerase